MEESCTKSLPNVLEQCTDIFGDPRVLFTARVNHFCGMGFERYEAKKKHSSSSWSNIKVRADFFRASFKIKIAENPERS